KEVKFSYAVLKEKTSMVQNALIALGVSFEQLPYEETTTELLAKSKKALRKCVETTKKLTIEIGYLKDQVSILQFNEEIILARLTREQAKEKLVLAKHLVVIRAWVNQDDQKKIVTFLQKQFDNALFFSFEEP